MARANDSALDTIEDVLSAIRAMPGAAEKKRGVFYKRRDAFVHFHIEDGAVLADAKLKPGADFTRFPLRTKAERAAFVKALRAD